MPSPIQLVGIERAVANLAQLPRRVAHRHLRIALNAAGGTIRDSAKTLAPRESGTLRQSLRVKVKIPDASFDVRHHGKPAYAVIGPARGFSKQVTKRAGRHRIIGKRTKLGSKPQTRRPSRYAHFAEKHQSFIGAASKTAGPAATARAAEKLAKAFETEANLLPK